MAFRWVVCVGREKREVEDDLRRCRDEVEMIRRESMELRVSRSGGSCSFLWRDWKMCIDR